MNGKISFDWQSHPSDKKGLFEFSKENGIDTERYHPIAIEVWGTPPTKFTITAVDEDEVGRSWEDYLKEHDGELPVVKFNFDSTIDKLLNHMKMFSLIVCKELSSITINKVDITEVIVLE